MSQTPRTPHARDNASLDPGQDADDADRENDDLYGDENVDTGREQEAPPTGKRGRSPNWLPCELAAAFLCRQHAVREKGCQSKLVERQNAATRVYSSIIHTLDDLGLCSWSDGGDGRKLPGNARESVTQRTAPHVESKIYSKGDGVKASISRARASKTDQGNRSFRSTVSSISVCESPSAATVCSRTHQYDPSQPCSHFARPLCRGNIGFRLNPGREPY